MQAEQLLRGGRGPERTLPGSVTDTERVEVAVSPDGAPQSVVVEQRLRLDGGGDYFVKIPGPVSDVEALPGSTSQPGLRSGSLVWQGFATEGEMLAARVELDPEHEAARLPVQLRADGRVDGQPVDLSREIAGRLSLNITVTNNTAVTLSLPTADAPTALVSSLLGTLRSTLSRGQRPDPGHGGLPRAVRVTSDVTQVEKSIAAPLRVRIRISLGSEPPIERTVVLSGQRITRTFRVETTGSAAKLGLAMVVEPVPPPASEIARLGGTGRAMLDRLVTVLAEAARLPDVDGYLGNPDRDGPTATTYHYALVGAEEQTLRRPAPGRGDPPASVFGIVLAVVLILLTIAGLTVWWASS
jgi:hypothetical protein